MSFFEIMTIGGAPVYGILLLVALSLPISVAILLLARKSGDGHTRRVAFRLAGVLPILGFLCALLGWVGSLRNRRYGLAFAETNGLMDDPGFQAIVRSEARVPLLAGLVTGAVLVAVGGILLYWIRLRRAPGDASAS